MRIWSNGRMPACHAGDESSILSIRTIWKVNLDGIQRRPAKTFARNRVEFESSAFRCGEEVW
jgi:hypothetical protein